MGITTRDYQGLKTTKKREKIITNDALAIEQMLQIRVNDKALAVLMRTPDADEALIRGFLYTEDIYKDKNKNPEIEILKTDQYNFPIEVNLKIDPVEIRSGYLSVRSLLSVSSCGICGKTELQTPDKTKRNETSIPDLSFEQIHTMFSAMQDNQAMFNLTGGTHAAAGFSKDCELLSLHEDIGRHNAVDKVIGDLLLQKKLKECKTLLLSGRASYEIVSKCFIAGIPRIAVVSAPSSLAVDYAKELGITLLGFCREDRMTEYSSLH